VVAISCGLIEVGQTEYVAKLVAKGTYTRMVFGVIVHLVAASVQIYYFAIYLTSNSSGTIEIPSMWPYGIISTTISLAIACINHIYKVHITIAIVVI
jgi:hypothetical protein